MQEVCQKQWRDGRSLHRQDKIGGEKMSIFQQLNLVFSLFVVATPDAMIDILFRISCISCSDSPCKSYLFLVLDKLHCQEEQRPKNGSSERNVVLGNISHREHIVITKGGNGAHCCPQCDNNTWCLLPNMLVCLLSVATNNITILDVVARAIGRKIKLLIVPSNFWCLGCHTRHKA